MAAAEGMPQGLLALGDIIDYLVLEYAARKLGGRDEGRRERRAQAASLTPRPCVFCKKPRVYHYKFCKAHKNHYNHMLRSARKHSERAHWLVKVAELFIHADHRFHELMSRYMLECPMNGKKRRADFDWDLNVFRT